MSCERRNRSAASSPTPTATVAITSSGTTDSIATTLRSVPSGTPVSRSRLNGRLRSPIEPATLTARLHPAIGKVARITASASCW